MEGANRQAQSTSSSSSGFKSPSFLRRVDTALGFFVTGVGATLYKLGVQVPEQVAYAEDRARVRRELDEAEKFIQAYDARNSPPTTVFAPKEAEKATSSSLTHKFKEPGLQ